MRNVTLTLLFFSFFFIYFFSSKNASITCQRSMKQRKWPQFRTSEEGGKILYRFKSRMAAKACSIALCFMNAYIWDWFCFQPRVTELCLSILQSVDPSHCQYLHRCLSVWITTSLPLPTRTHLGYWVSGLISRSFIHQYVHPPYIFWTPE